MLSLVNRNTSDGPADWVQAICKANEAEFVALFHEMRVRRVLSTTIRAINGLLDDVENGAKARAALSRMGLEFGG